MIASVEYMDTYWIHSPRWKYKKAILDQVSEPSYHHQSLSSHFKENKKNLSGFVKMKVIVVGASGETGTSVVHGLIKSAENIVNASPFYMKHQHVMHNSADTHLLHI